MKCYTHPSYSYVTIVEVGNDEISKLDFAACKEPRETLGSFYNRQNVKPNVLINAGFFAMSNGTPCFNNIDEGVVRSNNNNYRTGIGTVKGAVDKLVFGSLDSDISWNDFLSAYPVLLDGNGPITKFTTASEINYNAARSCLAFNDTTVFVVHIGKPGMTFSKMSSLLYNIGAKYAINLDGGGSARLMVNGKVMGTPTENRSVDNVFCIYLKTGEEEDNEIVSDTPYTIYTVKSGDSWWKIAQNELGNGSKYTELMAFNGVSSTVLRVGQKVKIPVNEICYVVKSGDSWWSIAATQMGSGTRYKELIEYNNKTLTTVIHPGDILKIPV